LSTASLSWVADIVGSKKLLAQNKTAGTMPGGLQSVSDDQYGQALSAV
jgi:hypothetical protein